LDNGLVWDLCFPFFAAYKLLDLVVPSFSQSTQKNWLIPENWMIWEDEEIPENWVIWEDEESLLQEVMMKMTPTGLQ
jgi:hypothetical protein